MYKLQVKKSTNRIVLNSAEIEITSAKCGGQGACVCVCVCVCVCLLVCNILHFQEVVN